MNRVVVTIAALCVLVGAALVLLIGLPAWRRYEGDRGRGQRRRECTFALRSACNDARVYRQEHDRVVADFKQIGFEPPPGNHYLYVADVSDGGFVRADPKFGLVNGDGLGLISEWVDVGVSGTCPKCSLTVACAGNLDTDDTLDVWSVSTDDRVGPAGTIPSCVPFNHVDDFTNTRVAQHIAFPAQ